MTGGLATIDALAADAVYRGLAAGDGGCFLGIRYAEAPVGPLRFRPPQAVAATPGVIVEAIHPLPSPPQIVTPAPNWTPRRKTFVTGEDCLNLNVFTPGCDGKARPVVIHVFGGGFQTGSINGGYQDDIGFACRGDVVLVRPNMRTGSLGFLHLGPAFGEGFASANRGMLDLIAALRWVKRNIAAFGGDPANITLVGMSSGAFTIAGLLGAEGVEDLFARAWLMSGSASRIIDPSTAAEMAADFLNLAGIPAGDVASLQALPIERILDIQNRIVATDLGERNAPGGRTFGIVADGASLLHHPLAALGEGRWRDKQIVAGWSRHEARMWYAFGIMKGPEDRSGLLRAIGRFHGAEASRILAGYDESMPGATLAAIEERFLSDTVYKIPAQRTLQTHSKAGGKGFAYEFAWVSPFEGGRLGASHGFDEPFVFGSVEADRVPLTAGAADAEPLAREMNLALYRFARTGDPGWKAFGGHAGEIKIFGEDADRP